MKKQREIDNICGPIMKKVYSTKGGKSATYNTKKPAPDIKKPTSDSKTNPEKHDAKSTTPGANAGVK